MYRFDGSTDHKDILGKYPGALHRAALGLDEEGSQRIADQAHTQVQILALEVFRGAWEAAGGAMVEQACTKLVNSGTISLPAGERRDSS
ncbi:hypothetical protein [Pseudoxanthomonas putridarboris]|uniref:Uncharacterized protein n=1 Tax=Pseudoxanthomonas putridarboris TaxID=752605 RepID=A0ABU9IZM9_9GAMM